jgi:hypothetical protein
MKAMATILLALSAASTALAADRLTDRDVKSLVDRIDEGRDRFEDALDDQTKHSIIRSPSGELNVEHFLDDFHKSIDRLHERLKSDYAASPEVAAVLRQGSAIERHFREQPAGRKGDSEWTRLATDLKSLADAYGAEFPLAETAVVRRMGDGEVAAAADGVARTAQNLKKSLESDLKKDASIDKPSRDAIVREADQLAASAKTVRDRVRDGKPSSSEVGQLLTGAVKIGAFINGHHVPSAAAAWTAIGSSLQGVASAHRLTWPPA